MVVFVLYTVAMTLPTLGRFVVPEIVATHFLLNEGDHVADFGAGSGFFIPILSAAVGPHGRVYACEIQKSLVEKVGALVQLKSLANVDVLWCDLEESRGIKIADRTLDAAILINTLFLIVDKVTAITEMKRTLRQGGVLHVIDWTESFGGLGPQQSQVISQAEAIDLFESHGFMFEREYPSGEHHYGVTFRKL
jgi:ubiquinone/menaquinone biosynthesis C-methylase UbiE